MMGKMWIMSFFELLNIKIMILLIFFVILFLINTCKLNYLEWISTWMFYDLLLSYVILIKIFQFKPLEHKNC